MHFPVFDLHPSSVLRPDFPFALVGVVYLVSGNDVGGGFDGGGLADNVDRS
jgi:hypothetical protein